MSNIVTSQIRTWVPVIIGGAIAWAATELEVVLDEQTSQAVIAAAVAIVTGVWHLIFRLLEDKISPSFGWLLGRATEPAYSSTAAPIVPKHLSDKGQVNLAFLVIVALVVIIILMATGAIDIKV